MRTARRAASFTIFAKSAPANPLVAWARFSKFTLSSSFTFFAWILKIASLPLTSGLSTTTCLSKRPGRKSAGARISGRFVAARIISPFSLSKPSISTRSWLRVCSRSSFPPMLLTRLLPMASSSSIKIIHGAFSLACLNKSRTRLAPTPTNISTKSEPLILKKGTPASPATALASRVLPVPGGPTRRTPFGILPPISVYFFGVLRKSTTSINSSFASSTPATSSNLVLTLPSSTALLFELPMPKTLPPIPPPPILLNTKKYIRKIKPNGIIKLIRS